jgi:hypothetical protein
MVDKWPLYFSDNIHISNPESETVILCLWTKKERLIEKLNPELYSIIGQLYSKDYGVMILIRNLLAKNNIRNLVLTGIDLNGSGQVISSLFNEGIEQNGKIKGTEIYLDEKLIEHVETIRKRINFVDLTHIKKFEELNFHLNFPIKGATGENIILPLPKLEPPRRLPTDFSGYKARGINFTTAYKSLINFILKFGVYNEEEKKLKVWNTTLIAKKVTEQDKQFLGNKKETKTKPDSNLNNKYFDSYFFKKLDAWNELQELARNHENQNSLNIISFELFIQEKDLESAYELIGTIPDTQAWDQDPHGALFIRVENGLIRVNHLDNEGKTLQEFYADNAKTLYKKIANENKISIFYHALDIGGELKKAEHALKNNLKYVQDKKE